ncbi:hypothetical protein HDV00_007118 [Rhizophlyctis rosea]|nr:hypothetical protein HDV00_007118 [Rhizophlyctis rosea]
MTQQTRTLSLKIPASTANIGPGFDTLGMALGLYLTLIAQIPLPSKPITPTTPLTILYTGEGEANVPLTLSENLIVRTALWVATINNAKLPIMTITIRNPIPLGRGLGSSGAAIVAGVVLANLACNLNLSKAQMLDYCTLLEGHPDNVAASLLGGFVASFVIPSIEAEHKAINDRHLILDPDVKGFDSTKVPRLPMTKDGMTLYQDLAIHPAVKAVVVVPQFELKTEKARGVLPKSYEKGEIVFNLQRVTVLSHALAGGVRGESVSPTNGSPNGTHTTSRPSSASSSHSSHSNDTDRTLPNPTLVHHAISDKIHQPYRSHLIPGLPEILSLTPSDVPGLLGVAMSGAGPSVLCLATGGFEEVGRRVKGIFERHGVDCGVMVLDIVKGGATWEC